MALLCCAGGVNATLKVHFTLVPGRIMEQIFMEEIFRQGQDKEMIQDSQHSFTQGKYAWPVWWPCVMGWPRQWSWEDWPVSSTWSSARLSGWFLMASLTPSWRDVDWKGGLLSGWGIGWMAAEVISSSVSMEARGEWCPSGLWDQHSPIPSFLTWTVELSAHSASLHWQEICVHLEKRIHEKLKRVKKFKRFMWLRTIPDMGTDWEESLRTALQRTWWFWWMKNWAQVSSVHWQPRGQTLAAPFLCSHFSFQQNACFVKRCHLGVWSRGLSCRRSWISLRGT